MPALSGADDYEEETGAIPYDERTAREQWAQNPLNWDGETGCPFEDRYSHSLADYAGAAEIETAIAKLEELWKAHGRRMRELKRDNPTLVRQPGESSGDYFARWWQMPEADRAVRSEISDLKDYRKLIRLAVADMRNDVVPWRTADFGQAANEVIAEIIERYEAAFKQAWKAWEQETLAGLATNLGRRWIGADIKLGGSTRIVV